MYSKTLLEEKVAEAIFNNRMLEITYEKKDGTKVIRTIKPEEFREEKVKSVLNASFQIA